MSGHGAFASRLKPGAGPRANEETVMPTAGVLEAALSTPRSRHDHSQSQDVLSLLSLAGHGSSEVDARLAEVARLPFVT